MKIPAFFSTRKGKILLGIIVLLIALRIALPYIILHYANKTLANMEGYYGHIQDIDVALFRGAYTIDSFYLNKLDKKGDDQTPFLSSREIDLSLEWGALFHGRIVGELVFERPSLRFTKDKVELDEVSQDTSDFRELLHDFMPVKVNRVEIRNGNIRYVDQVSSPKVDVAIERLDAIALNLKNAYKKDEVLPATLEANGNVYAGTLHLSMRLNPLAEQPAFDLNTEIEHTDMTRLNDFFQAYGNFDVNKGEFNMYAEAATKDGKFTGYVKPVIHDLDVVSWKGQDKNDGFFRKIWESIVGGVGEVFENQSKDQLATRISFSGNIDSPKPNIFQTIITVLQNAFIEALKPSIENKINLQRLAQKDGEKKQGFFKALFGDKKDKKKAKKDKD